MGLYKPLMGIGILENTCQYPGGKKIEHAMEMTVIIGGGREIGLGRVRNEKYFEERERERERERESEEREDCVYKWWEGRSRRLIGKVFPGLAFVFLIHHSDDANWQRRPGLPRQVQHGICHKSSLKNDVWGKWLLFVPNLQWHASCESPPFPANFVILRPCCIWPSPRVTSFLAPTGTGLKWFHP